VWFGGGKLAADLTMPKLRRRWEPARVTAEERFTVQERNAFWELAAQIAADASAQIRSHAATSPAAAADAAWAAADAMHAAAAALGSRILRQAADSYDRAARAPYGRIPAPTPAGNRLRRGARLLQHPPRSAATTRSQWWPWSTGLPRLPRPSRNCETFRSAPPRQPAPAARPIACMQPEARMPFGRRLHVPGPARQRSGCT
jgi:hypothetical protein